MTDKQTVEELLKKQPDLKDQLKDIADQMKKGGELGKGGNAGENKALPDSKDKETPHKKDSDQHNL